LNKKLEDTIRKYLSKKGQISKQKLAKAISRDFPSWSEATIDIRISQLKKQGIIRNPSKGIYSLGTKTSYKPEPSRNLKKLYNRLRKEFPFATFCVWDTNWISEFMRHQSFKHYLVLEAEKEVMESAFNLLTQSSKNVFLEPQEEIYTRYISNLDESIIIKKLVSESPVENINGITVPTLEKLLVDMLIDKDLFAAQQGEIEFIFRMALEKYEINKLQMKRYAKRRNRDNEVTKILNSILVK
jgi:predicted transcriptional regulator